MPSAPLRNMQVTLAACFLALAPARPGAPDPGPRHAMKVPPPGSGVRVPGGAAARARKPGLLPWEGGVAATRGTPARYSIRGRRLPNHR